MVDLEVFEKKFVGNAEINYDDLKKDSKDVIPNLMLSLDKNSELSKCMPKGKIEIENLAVEYMPEGKKIFSNQKIWQTKFLNVTNSLTLIDCCFGTREFKAEKLKNDWIFRNIKELNLYINEIPSMLEFAELLKMSPDLEKIEFSQIRLSMELLTTILKYKNIKSISCRGVEINLEGLAIKEGKLNINLSKFKEIEQVKDILSDKTEVSLKISNRIEIDSIEEILNNVTSVDFDKIDITNEELKTFVNRCPKIREISIHECKKISNIEAIKDNENLQRIIIDGKKVKEHIIIKVPKKSDNFKNNAIINQKEIETLELVVEDSISVNSINCNSELVINNLIIRNVEKKRSIHDLRVGLMRSNKIKVNNIHLENCYFSDYDEKDEIYMNTKRMIISISEIHKGGKVDNFLSYASSLEEVEFTNLELDYNVLDIVIAHDHIKKLVCNGTELHLEGIGFYKEKLLIINLDTFQNIEEILTLVKRDPIEIEVQISDDNKISSLEKIAPYVNKLYLSRLEITEEKLVEILEMSEHLEELKIQECEKIQKVPNIEQYENLKLAKLDETNLLQIPGVTLKKKNEYYNNYDIMEIDLREYNGSSVVLTKYEEVESLQIILSKDKSIGEIKIIGAEQIKELQIINSDEEENTKITKEAEKFLDLFKKLKQLSFDKCDLDFSVLRNLESLEELSINSSNVNNANLRLIPGIYKKLNTIKITNCRNLTDISALAQLEKLKDVDVSNNRICKGIDLLINYMPIERLKASNNLITNEQVKYLFQNENLSSVDLSRNPITNIVVPKERKNRNFMRINLEGCLLSTVRIDEKIGVLSDGRIEIEKDSTGIYVQNNPLVEPNKYLSDKQLDTFEKQKNTYKEIEILLNDTPEEQKRIEYIKACKKYYNIPENGELNKKSQIYNSYIGTLAFMGIVAIENDFYYYDGNTIQPIIEKNPQILLQDEEQEIGILESYLGEEIENSPNKIVNMYRMLEDKPRKLEFENGQILSIFEEELKQKLPESIFFSFTDRKEKEIHMFELPKEIDIGEEFSRREYESNLFNKVFGGMKIKFINPINGTCTFLSIPNTSEIMLQEDMELKKRNIAVLKEIISDNHFYLEDATDSDIVIMEDEKQEEKVINFLMGYLPCKKDEIVSQKTAKQELLDSFNLSSYVSILTYGQHIQQEVTEKLNDVGKKMTDSSEEEKVSCALKKLNAAVVKKEEDKKPTKKKGLFQIIFNSKKEEEYDNSDAEKQMQTIEQIKEELEVSAQNIMDSISNCKLVQSITMDYTEKLDRYIQVAKDKLEEMNLQGDISTEQIEMLKRKIQSLEVSKILARQTCAQFSILAGTKANLFEKVCTATQLIPILASQSILRLNIDSQNGILDLNKNMYQYTQDTILNNATALKETVGNTLSQEDSIEILQSVIKSVDEIAEATKKGLATTEGIPNLYIEDRKDFSNDENEKGNLHHGE